MNGELAQLLALVAHGNAHLNGAPTPATSKTPAILTFAGALRFARYAAPDDETPKSETLDGETPEFVAHDFTTWLVWLRAHKVRRLWAIAPAWKCDDWAEHLAVAFAGAAPQVIQADLPAGYEIWSPRWRVIKQRQQTWSVEYKGVMAAHSRAPESPNLGAARDDLRRALEQTLDFVARADIAYTNWEFIFRSALQELDNRRPPRSDLLPRAGFPLEARQLMAGASRAYVFGGMGSWNDLGFDAALGAEYDRVSGALYAAVKAAALAAANGYQTNG